MASIPEIQAALAAAGLDGWLFCDFRGSDPLAYSVLGLPRDRLKSRRWFYFVPAAGEPVKLVHAIEPAALDALPGVRHVYLPWQQLHERLGSMLAGRRRVAMQYSPHNAIPYVSRVDAGTVELIRSLGVEVATSADLIQRFEAVMTDAQAGSHIRAADLLGAIVTDAFAEIGRCLKSGRPADEHTLQQWIWQRFDAEGLIADHAPIVAADAHAADPHFSPDPADAAPLVPGRWVLIDAWCKLKAPGAIYADITWVGCIGRPPTADEARVFGVVRDARDAAVRFVREGLAAGRTVRGCDVDDACRAVIAAAGYADRFIHRTGHSIHEIGHGNGANIDNLETRDERPLLPRTCFSVEPGVYLPGRFGVRSEINVYLPDAATAVVTGIAPQQEPIVVGG